MRCCLQAPGRTRPSTRPARRRPSRCRPPARCCRRGYRCRHTCCHTGRRACWLPSRLACQCRCPLRLRSSWRRRRRRMQLPQTSRWACQLPLGSRRLPLRVQTARPQPLLRRPPGARRRSLSKLHLQASPASLPPLAHARASWRCCKTRMAQQALPSHQQQPAGLSVTVALMPQQPQLSCSGDGRRLPLLLCRRSGRTRRQLTQSMRPHAAPAKGALPLAAAAVAAWAARAARRPPLAAAAGGPAPPAGRASPSWLPCGPGRATTQPAMGPNGRSRPRRSRRRRSREAPLPRSSSSSSNGCSAGRSRQLQQPRPLPKTCHLTQYLQPQQQQQQHRAIQNNNTGTLATATHSSY